MATKRTPVRTASKAAGKAIARPRLSWKAIVLLILAGGVVFNLDRIAVSTGFAALVHQALPSSITRYMPGAPPVLEGIGQPDTVLTGRITKVYDGDTAVLLSPDGTTRYKLRFYGIDAPESDQRYGKDSFAALLPLIENREVRAEVKSVDRYNRSVAKIYVDDLYVNLWMVLEGHAWYYRDYANDPELAAAEREARSLRRGLWQDASPQPPWEYRQEQVN